MNLFACSITSGVSFSGGNTPPVQNAEPDSREYEYQGYSRRNDDRQYLLFLFIFILCMLLSRIIIYKSMKKAGDDEGDLLPFE